MGVIRRLHNFISAQICHRGRIGLNVRRCLAMGCFIEPGSPDKYVLGWSYHRLLARDCTRVAPIHAPKCSEPWGSNASPPFALDPCTWSVIERSAIRGRVLSQKGLVSRQQERGCMYATLVSSAHCAGTVITIWLWMDCTHVPCQFTNEPIANVTYGTT